MFDFFLPSLGQSMTLVFTLCSTTLYSSAAPASVSFSEDGDEGTEPCEGLYRVSGFSLSESGLPTDAHPALKDSNPGCNSGQAESRAPAHCCSGSRVPRPRVHTCSSASLWQCCLLNVCRFYFTTETLWRSDAC